MNRKNDAVALASEQLACKNPDDSPLVHHTVNIKNTKVPLLPDGGFGWLVVACAAMINCINLGVMMSFGILFSKVLNEMNVSTTYVTWILNVNSFLFNLTATMVGPLYHHLGARLVATVSSFVAAIGFMLLYFTSSPIHILLLFGIVIGLSGGPPCVVGVIVVGEYFDRHLGAATGIVSTGIAVGQILIPQFLRILLDEYGFRGAALIFGAFVLHCCVFAQVFHPVRQHYKWTAAQTTESSAECEMLNTAQDRKVSIADKSKTTQSNIFFEIVTTTKEQLKAIKILQVFIMSVGFTIAVIANLNVLGLVPFAMQAAGHSPQEASNSISVSAVGGAVTRVIVCICSDRKWFNRKYCYISGLLLSSICIIVTAVGMQSVEVVMISLAFYGIGFGCSLATFHALIADTCGKHLYLSTITINSLCMALFSIVCGPIVGLIRDHSSYTWSLSVCSALLMCSSLLWLLECFQRNKARQKETT